MNKYGVHVWITTKDIATRTDRNVYLDLKLSTIQSKQAWFLLSCDVNCKTHKLFVASVNIPRPCSNFNCCSYSKLQMCKGSKRYKQPLFNCTILISHHEPAMGKLATKHMNDTHYRVEEGYVASVYKAKGHSCHVNCEFLWPNFCSQPLQYYNR